MLFKLHLSQDELAIIDDSLQDYALMEVEAPSDTAESAAKKIKLLREYVELSAKVGEVMRSRDGAKKEYIKFTFSKEE